MLRGKPDELVAHFGLKCSSWTPVNCGTSSRSPCSSIGNLDYGSVKEANMLASRWLGCMLKALQMHSYGSSSLLEAVCAISGGMSGTECVINVVCSCQGAYY